jgi:hypothetical protein
MNEVFSLTPEDPHLYPGYTVNRSTAAIPTLGIMGLVALRGFDDNGEVKVQIVLKNLEEACQQPNAGVPNSCGVRLKEGANCEELTPKTKDVHNISAYNPWDGSLLVQPDKYESATCNFIDQSEVTCLSGEYPGVFGMKINVTDPADVAGHSALVIYDYNGKPSNCLMTSAPPTPAPPTPAPPTPAPTPESCATKWNKHPTPKNMGRCQPRSTCPCIPNTTCQFQFDEFHERVDPEGEQESVKPAFLVEAPWCETTHEIWSSARSNLPDVESFAVTLGLLLLTLSTGF